MKQSDSSSSSSSDEDSSSNEEIETKKELPSRSTRGLRMNKLLGEAKEADQDFWEQDAWNIDDNDAQYSSEEGMSTPNLWIAIDLSSKPSQYY